MFLLKSNMSGFAALEPYGLIAAFFAGSSFAPPACPACPECPVGAPCVCNIGAATVLALVGFGVFLGVWAKSHLGKIVGSGLVGADVPSKGKGSGTKGQWLARIGD